MLKWENVQDASHSSHFQLFVARWVFRTSMAASRRNRSTVASSMNGATAWKGTTAAAHGVFWRSRMGIRTWRRRPQLRHLAEEHGRRRRPDRLTARTRRDTLRHAIKRLPGGAFGFSRTCRSARMALVWQQSQQLSSLTQVPNGCNENIFRAKTATKNGWV